MVRVRVRVWVRVWVWQVDVGTHGTFTRCQLDLVQPAAASSSWTQPSRATCVSSSCTMRWCCPPSGQHAPAPNHHTQPATTPSTHLLLLKLLHHVRQQRVVKVLAAQEGVAVGGLDLQERQRKAGGRGGMVGVAGGDGVRACGRDGQRRPGGTREGAARPAHGGDQERTAVSVGAPQTHRPRSPGWRYRRCRRPGRTPPPGPPAAQVQ